MTEHRNRPHRAGTASRPGGRTLRVAVTGASGFVGGAVCRAAVAEGWTVFAFGRRPGVDGGHVGHAPYTPWDLLGERPEPREVDAVIHCAGSVTDWGPARDIWAANVDGTRNASAAFPGARFVHVSTASVYDPFLPTVMATEDAAPVRRYAGAYGASKAAAERCLERAVILRPHAVYGRGDTTLLPRVLGAVRRGRLLAVGDGRQRISLTSVDNLVLACLLAASGPVDHGVFNVTDAEPVVLDDALRTILSERGIDAEPYYLPLKLVDPVAAAAEAAFRLLRRPHPPRLTRYAAGHLAVERTLDITAARTHLGYRPSVTSFVGSSGW
ncbi:NAD(P)-dependent oxidoreductase [Streptosporangium sp. NBC_01755]|uniref:NAD-dependent epimerase/dehydratase family protein n=1 Tax=unclassified Streptosporangium TaxID=2632669 RepID=UPI002DDC392A|nr:MULTISPECIES: NAD(P)-dependent oxidoreductase [unclassified Streptosporangium]WSA25354.1 NAD(P)-dependent oxidoreductase [Streptosporangium sp. NBC_01810]WSD03330.1 NAD(P)-dependent oxidoreductase [Streptosporangium sp. NBC_01755]